MIGISAIYELVKLGYIGLFLLAFVSNAIPYSTIPYLVFIAPLLAKLSGTNLMLAIIALSLGATGGKLVVYVIGRLIGRIKKVDNYTHDASAFFAKHGKPLALIVFLTAALPIPDDIIYVPLSIARYNIWEYTLALLAGKIVVTVLAVIYGKTLTLLIEDVIGLPMYIGIPILILITILIVVITGKIDWLAVENVLIEEGGLKALKYLLISLWRILIVNPLNKLKTILE